MKQTKVNRKVRSDRNHVIYMMTCETTGKSYVGVTVVRSGNVDKSIQIRMTQHLHRAWVEESTRVFATALRKHAKWSVEPMMVVRGKAEAFAMEAAIINALNPVLNMTKKV
jgi:predicted GIY-YIG superfamily endonuclease